MTLTTALMGLLQAQGTDNARDYLVTYLANSLTSIDAHDHSNTKGAAVKRLANGTFASRPAAGNAGHVFVATDSNRVFWDNGTSWLEAIIQSTALGQIIAAGGLQVTAGNVGIGGAPAANAGLYVQGATLATGANQEGVLVQAVGSSAATTEVAGVYSQPQTAAAAFTCTTVADFHALNPTKGAGSTIITAYGLLVDHITAGNNNFPIVANGAGGAIFKVVDVGNGDVLAGPAASATQMSQLSIDGFLYLSTTAGAPSGIPTRASNGAAPIMYDQTNHKLWVYDAGLGWKGVVLT